MRVFFDTKHVYYLPQYFPVSEELERRGAECRFLGYEDPNVPGFLREVFERLELPYAWAESEEESLEIYQKEAPDWIIFGNGFSGMGDLAPGTRSAVINHGAGIKSGCFNPSINTVDARFLEGEFHHRKLESMYPKCSYLVAGFAKLDPLMRPHEPMLDLAAMGLDPSKPTILYAPTFFPSSIGRMSNRFPQDFADYNVIVKFHYFSHRKRRYRDHMRKLDKWRAADNVYIAGIDEFSVTPFMDVADLMISDASTTLFEFAALNRPVVWCDFWKVRWGYRGPFSYRLRRRMQDSMKRFRDIAAHAERYADLRGVVDAEIRNPSTYEAKRTEYAQMLLGPLDGSASTRIADFLLGTQPAEATPPESLRDSDVQPKEVRA